LRNPGTHTEQLEQSQVPYVRRRQCEVVEIPIDQLSFQHSRCIVQIDRLVTRGRAGYDWQDERLQIEEDERNQ
jgi:hypothetical protein